MTILLCTSADGNVLSPVVIYVAKSVNVLWRSDGIPEALLHDSGWISEEILIDSFENCFLEKAKRIDYSLLMSMYYHPIPIDIDAIDLEENNHQVLCLSHKRHMQYNH